MTVTNMTHRTPSDITMLLVAPGGQDTVLMSHAGAQFSIKSVTLNFDDAAATSLPLNTIIVSGTNKPTAYGSDGAKLPMMAMNKDAISTFKSHMRNLISKNLTIAGLGLASMACRVAWPCKPAWRTVSIRP